MAGRAWALISPPFFPLADLTRSYVVDGSSTSTVIVLPGTTTINGIATKRFQNLLASACTTTEMFHTSSFPDGIRLHRIVAPNVVILGSPRQVTVTFDPPVVLATAITGIDSFSFTEGTAEVVVSEVGTFASSSVGLFQVADIESVTVPAGTFNNAMRLEGVIIIEDPTIGTLQVSFDPIQLVADIGTVRSVVSLLNGAPVTSELASLPSNHAVAVTCGPNGIPNPVGTGETANLNVAAIDSQGHPLTYAWSASCPTLGGDISTFSPSPNVQTPTWTAPVNLTGSQQTCTIGVTVDDGLGVNTTGSFLQSVNSVPHDLTITDDPNGIPNPVASGGTANLSVAATDTLPHTLTYAWTADCPAALVGDGSFNNAALQTPTWTAPPNTTGSQQNCTIQVTVSDGQGLTQSPSFSQGVSSEGVGPSEPPVPQLLNLKTFDGADSEQQTFLPTDPIHVEATYFDPNAACAGVAPVLLQLLFFNLEGQLLVTREDVTSAPIAPGSKYRLLSATLAPGDLVPGAYTLIFLVRDCTNVNIFASGAYAIRVVTP